MARPYLPKGAERRLKAQMGISDRAARIEKDGSPGPQPSPFITLSRQYGCVAYDLANRLAQALKEEQPEWDFVVYDRKLLEEMASHGPAMPGLVESMTNRTRGAIEECASSLLGDRPSELQVFRRLACTVSSIAAAGQAIIIGRGGPAITRKLPLGIHVRLIAPLEWRVANLSRFPDRASEATPEYVQRADREREAFVKRYLRVDLNDAELYHLVLNAQRLSTETQVEMIAALVRTRCQDTGVPGPALAMR